MFDVLANFFIELGLDSLKGRWAARIVLALALVAIVALLYIGLDLWAGHATE